MGSAKDNFKKGAVEMLLLTMLCEEDMYGYQMAQLVKKRSKGEITIPEGSMYPTLSPHEQGLYHRPSVHLWAPPAARLLSH